MAKKTKAVKATNPKMVPEKEAFQHLLDLQFKVIMGNRKTRRMFMNFAESLPDDKKYFDTVVRALLTLIVQDEDVHTDYFFNFAGDPESEEIYFLAIDIREVLGYDVFDETDDETEIARSSRS